MKKLLFVLFIFVSTNLLAHENYIHFGAELSYMGTFIAEDDQLEKTEYFEPVITPSFYLMMSTDEDGYFTKNHNHYLLVYIPVIDTTVLGIEFANKDEDYSLSLGGSVYNFESLGYYIKIAYFIRKNFYISLSNVSVDYEKSMEREGINDYTSAGIGYFY